MKLLSAIRSISDLKSLNVPGRNPKPFRASTINIVILSVDRLTIAAEGSKADIAKPLRGFGPGIFEVALRYRSDAYRAVYAVRIAEAIWVVHAFQKKSKAGIATPKAQVDLVRARIKRLRDMLK